MGNKILEDSLISFEAVQKRITGKAGLENMFTKHSFDPTQGNESWLAQDIAQDEDGLNKVIDTIVSTMASNEGLDDTSAIRETLKNSYLRTDAASYEYANVGFESLDQSLISTMNAAPSFVIGHVVLGLDAKTKANNFFTPMACNEGEKVVVNWEIEQVINPADNTTMDLPDAFEAGQLGDLYDNVKLELEATVDTDDRIFEIGDEIMVGTLSDDTVKVVKGNFIAEAGREIDSVDLMESMTIRKVYVPKTGATPNAGKYVKADLEAIEVSFFTENRSTIVQSKVFREELKLTRADGTKIDVEINVTVDLQTGKYSMYIEGAQGFGFDIPFLDLERSNDPIRGFVKGRNFEFGVSYKTPYAVPVSKEFTERLKTLTTESKPGENPGVARAAYLIEMMTDKYAMIKDQWKEQKFYSLTARKAESCPLYVKLGGLAKADSFNCLTALAKTPVGKDNLEFLTRAVRNVTTNRLNEVERAGKLNPSTRREWIGYGHDKFVSIYTDVIDSNRQGSQDGNGTTKYGFALPDTVLGYSDSMGRRVKLYGSRYAKNEGKPIVFTNKIYDPKQPGLVSVEHSTGAFSAFSKAHIPQIYMSDKCEVEILSNHSFHMTIEDWSEDLLMK